MRKNHRSRGKRSSGQSQKLIQGQKLHGLLEKMNALKANGQHKDALNMQIRATKLSIQILTQNTSARRQNGQDVSLAEKELAEKKTLLVDLKKHK